MNQLKLENFIKISVASLNAYNNLDKFGVEDQK